MEREIVWLEEAIKQEPCVDIKKELLDCEHELKLEESATISEDDDHIATQDEGFETNDAGIDVIDVHESTNSVDDSKSTTSTSTSSDSKPSTLQKKASRKRESKDQQEPRADGEYRITEDNSTIFGEYVASEIRKMSRREQIIAKHLINNALFEVTIKKYNNDGDELFAERI